MSFHTTALGGSLFDMVDTAEYLKMSHEEQLKIATETVINEVREEAGYNIKPEQAVFCRKVMFNSMSNEYTWLFVVEVKEEDKCEPDPQNELEAQAEIVWSEGSENIINDLFMNTTCGKTLATMLSYDVILEDRE
jgi:8-oxo-dGTP pyrophosphatase MutT (NUDIX family)